MVAEFLINDDLDNSYAKYFPIVSVYMISVSQVTTTDKLLNNAGPFSFKFQAHCSFRRTHHDLVSQIHLLLYPSLPQLGPTSLHRLFSALYDSITLNVIPGLSYTYKSLQTSPIMSSFRSFSAYNVNALLFYLLRSVVPML